MTAQELAPGAVLDGFSIIEAIGHGAFSDIFRATAPDGREVVLKCPHEALLGDVGAFDRFRREMEIARRLDHPGIQRSFDTGETRSRPYLVMEYVDGETLRTVLGRRGRIPVPEAVRMAEQVASAMAHAHTHGVFHRDLKPENLLVTPDGRVVVTDFGIAFMEGARRLTWRWLTSTMGTPDYMSPEQVQGQRGDARSDVYAIGVILYEMLAGRVPWEGDNPLAIMSQTVNTPAPSIRDLVPAIPPPLDAVIRKCLRKDPAERYPDARALADDLEGWQDLDLSAFVFGAEHAPGPPSRRGAWILVVGISLGFLAATALIVLIVVLLHRGG